jgi:hypothetical protein
MDDILSIAQIERKFKSEWILVENAQTNDALEVQSGRVLWHSRDRDEVYRKAVELRPGRFAMLYTGSMPKDTAIVSMSFSLIRRGQSHLGTGPGSASHVSR